jgi:hypothetical protein
MTGRSEFRAAPRPGSTLGQGWPWFVDASVSLWQRCSRELTRTATRVSDKVVGVGFLTFLTFIVIGGLVVVSVFGILENVRPSVR